MLGKGHPEIHAGIRHSISDDILPASGNGEILPGGKNKGLSMGSPWPVHGLSMDCPWTVHGLSMDCPWTVYGLSMDCPWIYHPT